MIVFGPFIDYAQSIKDLHLPNSFTTSKLMSLFVES